MGSYINFNPEPRHVFQPPICDAENLQVPPLHCSFPAELNPLYEEVKEQCDGWIHAVAQPSSASARQLLLNCLLPRLVCRAIPASTSLKRLVHATKMISWLIIADEEDDHPAVLGADQITTTRHASQVLSILHRRPIHESAAATNTGGPLQKREAALLALASLWSDMQREMSPLLVALFTSAMEDYFQAVVVQATYRKANRLPDIDTYTEIRRHASFILPCFVLVEYALGIELDDATYSNASIQEFRTAALDYMCLCNDLISCKMEIGVGDYLNMPSIVYASTGTLHQRAASDQPSGGEWTGLQAAMDYVVDMVHGLDACSVSILDSMLPKHAASAYARRSAADQVVMTKYVRGL
ncbi:hypothetical protein L7F22_052438 [Adiantum nelumboides]|nr:hypothetical protein [Adiantum nelumboides]